MNAAHDGHTVAELIAADESKYSHELAAEVEFATTVQDHATCSCGAEIFPAEVMCSSCIHGSLSPEAAERLMGAAEYLEDR